MREICAECDKPYLNQHLGAGTVCGICGHNICMLCWPAHIGKHREQREGENHENIEKVPCEVPDLVRMVHRLACVPAG